MHGINLHENKEQILLGWEGRPKGLLQALWENGVIDEQREKGIHLTG
jgi:hypothetical protein